MDALIIPIQNEIQSLLSMFGVFRDLEIGIKQKASIFFFMEIYLNSNLDGEKFLNKLQPGVKISFMNF